MIAPLRRFRGVVDFVDQRRPLAFLLFVSVVYGVALAYAGGLDFPLYKDENQFWNQTVFFAERWPPDLETVRSYPEPMTPLSFLIWGTSEHFFGGGIAAGRLLNLAASVGLLAIVALHRGRGRGDPLLAAGGLLLFPYFVPMGVHLYTDMPAAFFVLVGFWFEVGRRRAWSALFFALGIATRQYMVVFPLALAADYLGDTLAHRGRGWQRIVPHALAAATLLVWVWLFGDWGPTQGLERWPRHTEALVAIIPENGLYFLICLGGYFAVPEFALFCLLPGRSAPLRALLTPKNAWLAAVLLGAFVLWPPVFGELGTRGAMGMFNRAGHLLVPNETARICVYFVLAWLTCVRFARIDLGFWLVFTNIAIMMYSTGWDKYLLPALATFWYLGPADGSCGPPLLWGDEPSHQRDDPRALARPGCAAP